jgi:ubiquitin thioesterase ZRANB1
MGYQLSQRQLCQEWGSAIQAAAQPGAALYQIHIFVLAHIFRRPIIVYGVKCIKSFRGEVLGLARFEGQ